MTFFISIKLTSQPVFGDTSSALIHPTLTNCNLERKTDIKHSGLYPILELRLRWRPPSPFPHLHSPLGTESNEIRVDHKDILAWNSRLAMAIQNSLLPLPNCFLCPNVTVEASLWHVLNGQSHFTVVLLVLVSFSLDTSIITQA